MRQVKNLEENLAIKIGLVLSAFIGAFAFYPMVYYNHFSRYPSIKATVIVAAIFTAIFTPFLLSINIELDGEE